MSTIAERADRRARGAGVRRRPGDRPAVGWTLLLAALPFGPRLTAGAVAEALAAGVTEAGLPEPDIAALGSSRRSAVQASGASANGTAGGAVATSLDAIDFDSRMRAARAVVIIAPRLDEQTLLGSMPFEIATRARQAGVPAYAVTRENALERFDARILDLQAVYEARSARALRQAGRSLAEIV